MNRLFILVVAIAACGGHSNAPPGNAAPRGPSCAEQTAELKLYLGSVLDSAAKPAVPWPTGNADTDRTIAELRDKYRKAAQPADPAAPVPVLAPGIKPGPLELELAKCPAAKNALASVSTANPTGEQRAAFVGVADGIAQCDCALNVPLVRALMYMLVRGPD